MDAEAQLWQCLCGYEYSKRVNEREEGIPQRTREKSKSEIDIEKKIDTEKKEREKNIGKIEKKEEKR